MDEPTYTFKQPSEPVVDFMNMKPNSNISFHRDGKQVGVLDFNGPEMTFSGDADESANVFFDFIAKSFKARLEQERADERNSWPAEMEAMERQVNILTDALAEQPAPVQQEPVASVRTWHKNGDQHAELDDWGLALALLPDGKHDLYTSPPAQRTWVGLTDEEAESVIDEIPGFAFGLDDGNLANDCVVLYAKAIEAKLKEKNT